MQWSMHLKIIFSRQRVYEILEVASKLDKVSRLVDVGLIVLILLSVSAIILESVEAINNSYHEYFYWFEIISISIFSIEYILRIWSCVDSPINLESNYSNFKLRIQYFFSFTAVIDLLAILPFYLMMLGMFGNADMRLLRSFRLLRIFKLTRYSAAFDVLNVVFKENIRAFGAAFFVLLVVMLLSASGMYYFEHEAQPKEFSSILASMWWAFTTLTTVGYGDVTPITVAGKIFGALITVVGVGMVALPTAILASAFSDQLHLRTIKYKNMADKAYEDGVLTDDEKNQLDLLRDELGIAKDTADEILNREKEKIKYFEANQQSKCPHCGYKLHVANLESSIPLEKAI
jgi:voltage-gated potassium channel